MIGEELKHYRAAPDSFAIIEESAAFVAFVALLLIAAIVGPW